MMVRLRRNAFDRWIILHPELDDAAWSGSRWVSIDKNGFPSGPNPIQVSNLSTEREAAKYATQFDFQTTFGEENENKKAHGRPPL